MTILCIYLSLYLSKMATLCKCLYNYADHRWHYLGCWYSFFLFFFLSLSDEFIDGRYGYRKIWKRSHIQGNSYSVCLSIQPSVCPSKHPTIWPSNHPLVYAIIQGNSIHLTVCLSVRASNHLSDHPSDYAIMQRSIFPSIHFSIYSSNHPDLFSFFLSGYGRKASRGQCVTVYIS